MNYRTIKAPFPAEIANIIQRLGIRKRSVSISEYSAGTPEKLRSYWDGGSRDEFRLFRNGVSVPVPFSGAPGFTAEPEPYIPEPGDILVTYGTFLGKPAIPHFSFYK